MPIFKRLEQVAEYHQLSPEDRVAYDISYKHWLDAYNFELARRKGLEEACAKSMAEGIDIGKVEGRKEEQLEIAKSFKKLGVDVATIAHGTGLSVEEIEKL